MPFVRSLRDAGVEFTNSVVTTPACCPFRASFLAGGFYAHETGVLANKMPNGGMERFNDTVTLPLSMQERGYRTGFVGKYFNNYFTSSKRMTRSIQRQQGISVSPSAAYIPPGWDKFVATSTQSSWYEYNVASGSTRDQPAFAEPRRVREYITSFHRSAALDFLDRYGTEPFMLLVAEHAPHQPATPARQDGDAFSDFVYRGRSWGEEEMSDKPRLILREAKLAAFPEYQSERDEFHRDQLRSLQAVDRSVETFVHRLERIGVLDRTVIAFTSDNGQLWGEHGHYGKNKAYEESIRVPLVVRGPGYEAARRSELVAVNLDLPATIFDLAGVPRDEEGAFPITQGESLLPLLTGGAGDGWREELYIENYVSSGWRGLRTQRLSGNRVAEAWMYIEHLNGDLELYDLIADPYQLRSVHAERSFNPVRQRFAEKLAPLKPLALKAGRPPDGRVGMPYGYRFNVCCVDEPPQYEIIGSLPSGLHLDAERGVIRGMPTRSGSWSFTVQASGSEIGLQSRRPKTHRRQYTVEISPPH